MAAGITFTVKGRKSTVTTERDRPLLDVLREDLHLTGTHYGCGEGRPRHRHARHPARHRPSLHLLR